MPRLKVLAGIDATTNSTSKNSVLVHSKHFKYRYYVNTLMDFFERKNNTFKFIF